MPSPQTVLLVGATGRTGRRALRQLLDRGASVRAIVRSRGRLPPEVAASSSLTAIEEKAENLAQTVAETAYDDSSGSPEHGTGGQVMSLDSSIIEKIGSINQALSTLDLEAGAGASSDEMDSICDLLDDLRNLIKRRATMLSGR